MQRETGRRGDEADTSMGEEKTTRNTMERVSGNLQGKPMKVLREDKKEEGAPWRKGKRKA